MSTNHYNDEIARLEQEREELLKRLSPEEREHYEQVKKKFAQANHGNKQEPDPEQKQK